MVAISFSLGKSPLNNLFASSPPNILHVDIQQKMIKLAFVFY